MFDFKGWFKQEKNNLKSDFYSYPKRKFLFLVLVILLLFSAFFRLWTATSFQDVIFWDNLIVNQIKQIRNPFLDNFFLAITRLGSIYFIAVAFLILTFFLVKKRMKKAATSVFLTLIGSAILIYLFKNFFGRSRPFECPFAKDCFSFPSGHATIAFYFYGMLFNLTTRFIKLRKRYVLLLALILGFLVFLIAVSRLYLGYHFLTDIFGGFLLGGIFLLLVSILIDFLYQSK
jgi:membrane-associated phospholipid phosphatase